MLGEGISRRGLERWRRIASLLQATSDTSRHGIQVFSHVENLQVGVKHWIEMTRGVYGGV
jgi:hypothetical protein